MLISCSCMLLYIVFSELLNNPQSMKDAWQVCTNQLGKDRLSLNSSPLPLKCFYIADNLVFLEGCSYKDTKNNFIEFIYQASIDI